MEELKILVVDDESRYAQTGERFFKQKRLSGHGSSQWRRGCGYILWSIKIYR